MPGGRAERGVWVVLTAVVVAVVAAGMWSMRQPAAPRPFPVIAELPDFDLIERSGRHVKRSDLSGDVWVADFIFTRCSGVCPVLSTRMAMLQRALRGEGIDARLVSFSVDPVHDTPEVLREYAQRYSADADRWLFLTGARDDLHALIGEGFLLSVAERSPSEADTGELITHSDRFVLVDRQSRIRGYYHGTDQDALGRLVSDIGVLAESD